MAFTYSFSANAAPSHPTKMHSSDKCIGWYHSRVHTFVNNRASYVPVLGQPDKAVVFNIQNSILTCPSCKKFLFYILEGSNTNAYKCVNCRHILVECLPTPKENNHKKTVKR